MAVLVRLAMVGVPRSADAAISLSLLQMFSLGLKVCGVTEGNADPQEFLPRRVPPSSSCPKLSDCAAVVVMLLSLKIFGMAQAADELIE